MVHLWRTRAKEETEISKTAPGVGATGDIAVIVEGKKLDNELVRLACLMARKAKRRVHLVHIIEVPRTLPLKAVLTAESEHADKLLTEALAIAEADNHRRVRKAGCANRTHVDPSICRASPRLFPVEEKSCVSEE